MFIFVHGRLCSEASDTLWTHVCFVGHCFVSVHGAHCNSVHNADVCVLVCYRSESQFEIASTHGDDGSLLLLKLVHGVHVKSKVKQ